MGLFDKFTLCCVVIVIVSLSGMLIGYVQILHRLEDGINRDNSELLHKIGALRLGLELSSLQSESSLNNTSNGGVLLAMVIKSAKKNYALRRAIRHTWAQTDHRVVHRFELHGSNMHPPLLATVTNGTMDWLKRLQHHHRATTTNARYLLIVNETVFVNTPLLLETVERILPRQGFILCKPVKNASTQNVTCDAAQPILVSMDVVHGLTEQYVVHDGRRLYLNHRETEALVRHQMDDEGQLTYFFTASLLHFSLKIPITQKMEQLWLSLIGNYTPVEY
uniref:Hexosyltransferase n=1 Tax=Anopheles christyi TaxID=43041 RepID=A0A182JQV6_9DIPT